MAPNKASLPARIDHFVDNNGVLIHCVELNRVESSLPLFIVPGMINSADQIFASIGHLLSRHAIIISVRGRGRSDSPKNGWSLESQASDVVASVNFFQFPDIALFGHSTGSAIAACALPALVSRVTAFIIGDFAPLYPQYSDRWAERVRVNPDNALSAVALKGIVADAGRVNVASYLERVKNSFFVITGDASLSLLKPEDIGALQNLYPDIKIERIAGAGHDFLKEAPEEACRVLEQILA